MLRKRDGGGWEDGVQKKKRKVWGGGREAMRDRQTEKKRGK